MRHRLTSKGVHRCQLFRVFLIRSSSKVLADKRASAPVRREAWGESSVTSTRAGTPASLAGQRNSRFRSGTFLRSIDGTGGEHLQHSNCNFEPYRFRPAVVQVEGGSLVSTNIA